MAVSVKALQRRLHNIVQITRLDKPIGIFLLLWPLLWALWIAAGFAGVGGIFSLSRLGASTD